MLIFFCFLDSDASWWRVPEDLQDFAVDLLSTEKKFSVDFICGSVDFVFCIRFGFYI